MEPGPDAIKQLERIHQTARWAWYRAEGCFALLELYPAHEAQGSLYEPWGRRGPVYGAPYDSDRFTPVWLANFSVEDVKNLSFTPTIRRWLTSMRDRINQQSSHPRPGKDHLDGHRSPEEPAQSQGKN